MKISKKHIRLILTLLLFFQVSALHSANPDSLKRVIRFSRIDTIKVETKIELYYYYLTQEQNLDEAKNVLNKTIALCEEKITKYKNNKPFSRKLQEQKIRSLLYKGDILKRQGELEKALNYLQSSLNYADSINFPYGKAQAFFFIGELLEYKGKLRESLEYFYGAKDIFNAGNHTLELAKTFNSLGHVYDYLGRLDTALFYYTEGLKNYEAIGHETGVANQYNNIGIIYFLKGEFNEALRYYYKSTDKHEKHDNIGYSYAMTKNNIGLVYESQGDLFMAISYYDKSFKLFTEKSIPGTGIVLPLNNLGEAFQSQGNMEKAMEFFTKSLEISRKHRDIQTEAYTLNKACNIYLDKRMPGKARYYCEECLKKYERIEDKHGIALALIGMGDYFKLIGAFQAALEYYLRSQKLYHEIGDLQGISKSSSKIGEIYLIQNKYDNAYSFAKKAYRLAKEIGHYTDIQAASRLLYIIYNSKNDYKNALNYYTTYVAMKDSVHSLDIRGRLQEQYYRHQYETKAITDSIEFTKTLKIKDLELQKQIEETKRQRWVIYSFIAGLALVLGFSLIVLKLYLDNKKANKRLKLSHTEINQKNEEIIAQRDQISMQHEFVLEQKNLLEKSHQRITDSIKYAELIQSALLPSKEQLSNAIPESLVFFKPSEIVSGDFYWFKEIGSKMYLIVADCTGHGVPGAFMSMLGIAFLNEIIRRANIKSTADILNVLRQEVITALNQEKSGSRFNEGMDVSVIAIDKKSLEAEFAGASSSIYIIRTNNIDLLKSSSDARAITKHTKGDYSLYEIIGDSMPVAKSSSEKSFKSHSFQMQKDDMIYLFSDGYIDQLNGKTNRRFTSKRFKNLLLQISNKSLIQKYNILESTLSEWKKDNEQTDDILIVGIKA